MTTLIPTPQPDSTRTGLYQAQAMHVLGDMLGLLPADLPCWVQVLGSQQATIHIDTAAGTEPQPGYWYSQAVEWLHNAFGGAVEVTEPRFSGEEDYLDRYRVTELLERIDGWRLSVVVPR